MNLMESINESINPQYLNLKVYKVTFWAETLATASATGERFGGTLSQA